MAATILFEEKIEIPLHLESFNGFRAWTLSDAFPDVGRIDFLGGRIEVEMSPEDLFAAGVQEFWLADARTDELLFQVHARGASGFEPVDRDRDGYQLSDVFGRRFRLDRARDGNGCWTFDLLDQ